MTNASDRRLMLALLVLSGLIISLCMGLRQSLGLFMRPMTLDIGVSRNSFPSREYAASSLSNSAAASASAVESLDIAETLSPHVADEDLG